MLTTFTVAPDLDPDDLARDNAHVSRYLRAESPGRWNIRDGGKTRPALASHEDSVEAEHIHGHGEAMLADSRVCGGRTGQDRTGRRGDDGLDHCERSRRAGECRHSQSHHAAATGATQPGTGGRHPEPPLVGHSRPECAPPSSVWAILGTVTQKRASSDRHRGRGTSFAARTTASLGAGRVARNVGLAADTRSSGSGKVDLARSVRPTRSPGEGTPVHPGGCAST